jgi:iron complex outermembrane receptor protein
MKQATLFANAGNDLGNGVKLYGWASYQNRDAVGRPTSAAVQDQNIASIYPDGFLPFIVPNVDDYAATGGVTWTIGDWDWTPRSATARTRCSSTWKTR